MTSQNLSLAEIKKQISNLCMRIADPRATKKKACLARVSFPSNRMVIKADWNTFKVDYPDLSFNSFF